MGAGKPHIILPSLQRVDPAFDWGATRQEYQIYRHPRAISDKRTRKITSGRIMKGL